MKRRLFGILLSLALAASPGAAAPTLWEQSAQLSMRDVERVDESIGAEISVREGRVVLTLLRPAVVRVLSILGQPLSQESLPAGVHRLKLTTKGIYILRVGASTWRITV